MAERSGFIVHEESHRNFERLSDERLGKLFRAMYRYASGQEPQTFPEDEVLDIIFEGIRERMDRDAERYEETCKARSEAGKRGGRPKKANGLSDKAKKANGFFAFEEKANESKEKQTKAKKAKCECDSDSECKCDPDPEPDPECVCDPEQMPAGSHTAHTAQSSVLSLQEVLVLASQLGYVWDEAEAQEFLAYNIDKGRTGGWGFAVRKWEANRTKHQPRNAKKLTAREQDELNDYLSVVNRFQEDDAS
jgi:hypothetical protein